MNGLLIKNTEIRRSEDGIVEFAGLIALQRLSSHLNSALDVSPQGVSMDK
jgi:hypothetical protein